jgi:hypothetical protein
MSSAFISAGRSWVPDSCTLPTVEQPLRVAELEQLMTTQLLAGVRVTPTHLRLSLIPGPEVAARAAELAARESECCEFFTFTLRLARHEVTLDVLVPEAQVDVLSALQGQLGRSERD